jgi:hypothetical protein
MRGNFDMSNDGKPKEDAKSVEFSIGMENGDFDGIPGVTQLLNPKIMMEKAAAKAARDKASATPPQGPATKSSLERNEPLPTPIKASSPQPAPKATVAAKPVAAKPVAAKEDEGIAIDFGSDDSTDPGVVHTSAQPTSRSSVTDSGSSATSLAEMGVQFELQFESERGTYRYRRMRPHGKKSFALWQEKFFYQMKIDLKALEVEGPFQEFAKATHPFHEDAFGLTDASFVQVVRVSGDTQKLYVLISEKSLVQDTQKICDFLSGKGISPAGDSSGDDDEFKIELAS